MTDDDLIRKAISVLNPRKLSRFDAEAGGVGCAVLSKDGNQNGNADVIVAPNKSVKAKDLLPYHWHASLTEAA